MTLNRSATYEALVAVLKATADHNKKIAAAIKKRPPAKDPGRKAYEETVMAPLYEEKERLRQAELAAANAANNELIDQTTTAIDPDIGAKLPYKILRGS